MLNMILVEIFYTILLYFLTLLFFVKMLCSQVMAKKLVAILKDRKFTLKLLIEMSSMIH